jgi:hypothetical protein
MWGKKRADQFLRSPHFPLAPGVFLAYIAGNAAEKAQNWDTRGRVPSSEAYLFWRLTHHFELVESGGGGAAGYAGVSAGLGERPVLSRRASTSRMRLWASIAAASVSASGSEVAMIACCVRSR